MDVVIQQFVNFGFDMGFLVALLIFQYILSRRFRKKNSIGEIFAIQLGLPLTLAIFVIILAPSGFGGTFLILGMFIMFAGLNGTSLWFHLHLHYVGDHKIVMKFPDVESESETVKIFESDTYIVRTVDEVMVRSSEIAEKLEDENFYKLILEKANPKAKLPPTDEAIEKKAKEVLKQKFGHFHLHQIFYEFYFLNVSYEDIEIRSKVNAFVMSVHEKLPRDVIMSCCFLQPRKIEGKWFSVVAGIEGILDEEMAQWMVNIAPDMEFFKLTTKYSDYSQVKAERDYWMDKCESMVKLNEQLSKENLSIQSRIDRYRREPVPPRPSSFSIFRKKKRGELE